MQSILTKVPRAERIIHLTQIVLISFISLAFTFIFKASSSIEKYRDINDAFLYGILALDTRESTEVSAILFVLYSLTKILKCFQLLHSIMQDQWEVFCHQCKYFTYSKYSIMKSGSKGRLLWLTDKLAALQAPGSENLYIGLLRQIKSTKQINYLN